VRVFTVPGSIAIVLDGSPLPDAIAPRRFDEAIAALQRATSLVAEPALTVTAVRTAAVPPPPSAQRVVSGGSTADRGVVSTDAFSNVPLALDLRFVLEGWMTSDLPPLLRLMVSALS
jgi:hypothetical protein